MFEKFTESAIKVITLAREEARRLEFAEVQLEHILLGILAERTGIGAQALFDLGLNLKNTRRVIERLIGRGYSNVFLNDISYSESVIQLIDKATRLSELQNAETVEAQHILLALVDMKSNNLKKLVDELKLEGKIVKQKVEEYFKNSEEHIFPCYANNLPDCFTPKYLTEISLRVLEDAKEETVKHGHIWVGTEQLLLALLREKKTVAEQILRREGLTEYVTQAEVYRFIGNGSGAVPEMVKNSYIIDRVLENAWIIAKYFSYAKIGTGHLLMGLLDVDEGTANYVFKQLDIDPEQMHWDIAKVLKKYPEDPEPIIEDIEKDLVDEESHDDELLDDELSDNEFVE